MKRFLAATAIAGALALPALMGALSGPVAAQQDGAKPGADVLDRLVDLLDTDKNGTIDRAEIEAARNGGQPVDNQAHGWFGRLDSDRNGSVSKEEFLAGPEKRFARLDKNGDGTIDREEQEAAREARRDWQGERGERPRHHFARHERFRHPDGKRAERLFERFDANGDGTITREEVEAAHGSWHDRNGKDRDRF
ncbi:EF-hand domain-containing protein [Terrihabitans sp. B22-R8]|uniref:EF-hand domain-containing protein n=1 Tax=Terrihabitans sp. B22-R8 TaxID=3425128 RepID=UPI00403CD7AD